MNREKALERRRKAYRKVEDLTDKVIDWAEAGTSPSRKMALWLVDAEDDRYVQRSLCWVLGHEVEDDHCGKPEHRHCVFCHQLFPCGIVHNGHLTTRPRVSQVPTARPRPSSLKKELLG